MKTKLTLIMALAMGASCLTTGCYVSGGYASRHHGVAVSAAAPVDYYYDDYPFIMPTTIIIENGVRHDLHFYRMYPGAYHRDLQRYPHYFSQRAHQHYRQNPPRHRPPGQRPQVVRPMPKPQPAMRPMPKPQPAVRPMPTPRPSVRPMPTPSRHSVRPMPTPRHSARPMAPAYQQPVTLPAPAPGAKNPKKSQAAAPASEMQHSSRPASEIKQAGRPAPTPSARSERSSRQTRGDRDRDRDRDRELQLQQQQRSSSGRTW